MSTDSATVIDCVEVWEGLLQSNAPTVSGASADYTPAASGGDTICTYTYSTKNENGNDREIIYNSADRSVDVNADGES